MPFRKSPTLPVCAGLIGMTLTAAAHAASFTTVTAGGNDGTIIYNAPGQTTSANSLTSSTSGASNQVIGVGGSNGAHTVSTFVMAFRLPTIPTGNAVDSATLTVTLLSKNGTPAFNADLWGLGYRNSNALVTGSTSDTTTTTDFTDVSGTNTLSTSTDTAHVNVAFSNTVDNGKAYGIAAREKLGDNVFTSATAVAASVTIDITAYLKELYAAGAGLTASTTNAGYSTDYAILRLSPDATINVGDTGATRYSIYTNNDGDSTAPTINYTYSPTPEPAGLTVLAGAGMLAMRRRRR